MYSFGRTLFSVIGRENTMRATITQNKNITILGTLIFSKLPLKRFIKTSVKFCIAPATTETLKKSFGVGWRFLANLKATYTSIQTIESSNPNVIKIGISLMILVSKFVSKMLSTLDVSIASKMRSFVVLKSDWHKEIT